MQRKIAVGAFNTANLEGLEAILGAAEELGLPVIAQFAQCHENLTPLEVIGLAMVYMAKRAAVPVCQVVGEACFGYFETGFPE